MANRNPRTDGESTEDRVLYVLAAIACGLVVSLSWLPVRETELGAAGDTYDYVTLARNVRSGAGFTVDGNVAHNRSPLYPFLLAFVDAAWINRVSGFVVGVSIAWLATLRFQKVGIVVALLAAWLTGHNEGLGYSAQEILTETLATALLTATVAACDWSERGPPQRSLVAGALHALVCLTRAALIWVGVTWLVWLLFRALRERRWGSLGAFSAAYVVPLVLWTAYLSFVSCEFIPLASTGPPNVAAGFNPIDAAKAAGQTPPELTDKALEKYWTAAPWMSRDVSRKIAFARLTDWRLQVRLSVAKFRIAERELPVALFYLFVIGTALWSAPDGGARWWPTAIASGITTLAVCGYSHPVLKLSLAVLAAIIVLTAKERRFSVISCLIGFVLLTGTAFGIPRFTRPFLPVFYLAAVSALPLAATSLLKGSAIETKVSAKV